MSVVSPIYRMGEQDPVPVDEAEFAEGCRRAWHERGIIVLRREDRQHMPTMVRMTLEAFAIGKFGKRKGEANG